MILYPVVCAQAPQAIRNWASRKIANAFSASCGM